MEIREKARNLSDEDFEVQKQAVYTKKAVKDINLSGMFARMAYEINSNRYMFDSQEQELEILQSVTKEDFYKEFEAVFFNKHTVKRLDVSLVSTKHAEEQVEYITKNADQEIFKEYVAERVRSPAGSTIEDFKKDKATYDDCFKVDYEKFVSKQHKL